MNMKRVKTSLWYVVIGFVCLVIFQNWEYFNARQVLRINLIFVDFPMPEFSNFFLFLSCFLVGLGLAYSHGFVTQFRSKQLIKRLGAATEAQQEEISGLKRELETLQKGASETEVQQEEISGLKRELGTLQKSASETEAQEEEISGLKRELETLQKSASETEAQQEEISGLKRELEMLRKSASEGDLTSAEASDPAGQIKDPS